MRRSARSSRADLGKRPSPDQLPQRGAARRSGVAHWLSCRSTKVLQSLQAVHGDCTLHEVVLEKRGLRSSMPGGRVACDGGVSRSGGIHVTPAKERINCIERLGGSAGIVLALGQPSRQHTELRDLSRGPRNAPARRKALIREFRYVSLQPDGQIAKLPCCFAPRSTVGGRNHDRTGPGVRIISSSPGMRHRQPTRVHPFYCSIAQCARVSTTTWRNGPQHDTVAARRRPFVLAASASIFRITIPPSNPRRDRWSRLAEVSGGWLARAA